MYIDALSACMSVQCMLDIQRGLTRTLDTLELGLQMVVSHHVRAPSALNCFVISPALKLYKF